MKPDYGLWAVVTLGAIGFFFALSATIRAAIHLGWLP